MDEALENSIDNEQMQTEICSKPIRPQAAKTENRRRQFIGRSLVAAGSLAGTAILHNRAFAVQSEQSALRSHPDDFADGNQLERMRIELLRALEKNTGERKWAMVIDQQKCIGCSACTVSCCAENNLPPGVVYRPVLRRQVGQFPNVGWVFTPRPCMHCDNPPCVPVCPVTATWKDPDGAVIIDYDVCIGCRNCLVACPCNRVDSCAGRSGMVTIISESMVWTG